MLLATLRARCRAFLVVAASLLPIAGCAEGANDGTLNLPDTVVDAGHSAASDGGSGGADTGATPDTYVAADSGSADAAPDATPGYAVGGTVSGLQAGDTLTLEDNGGAPLTLTANGAFSFPLSVPSGQMYNVAVVTQPAAPAETCSIFGGTGTVGQVNVNTVIITCEPQVFSVGGTVSGLLAGQHLVLELGGTSPLSVPANGSFAFAMLVASGSPYDVTVATNPTSETCTVANGTGTVGSAAVDNVLVTCSCAPTTCAALGANCGQASDGCGGTLECGSCATGESCGAGGTANVCAACGVAVANTIIAPGETLSSCDGRFVLDMQASDGNLVLYMGTTALWNAGTFPNPGAQAVMQGDGNFVVYGPSGQALWSSGTNGNPGAKLDIQNDGNMVVLGTVSNVLWTSDSCCH